MKIIHFYPFDSDPRFPPFLLYVRWKSGVTFVRRCFRDENHFSGPIESWYFADIMVLRGYERETGSLFVTLTGAGNVIGRAIGAVLRFYVK